MVQLKACWFISGGVGRFSCKRTYALNFAFAGSLQERTKIKKMSYSAKFIHSKIPRTIKKRKLDSRAFLGVLIRFF